MINVVHVWETWNYVVICTQQQQLYVYDLIFLFVSKIIWLLCFYNSSYLVLPLHPLCPRSWLPYTLYFPTPLITLLPCTYPLLDLLMHPIWTLSRLSYNLYSPSFWPPYSFVFNSHLFLVSSIFDYFMSPVIFYFFVIFMAFVLVAFYIAH